MNKLLASIALALALPSTGCFTAAGAVIGSQSTSHEVTRNPDGSHTDHESNNLVTGLLVGAAIDAALIFAASQVDLGGSCFTYGPGEGEGPC